ncbi:gamma-glutamylcyclotransferase [Corallococcus exiguus]|uniref:gamma-glutamylcyclotransferase family protein n=1 Tax=Corallococcus exiguus TaxID=83462 RepID=UPI001471B417|nr:gamma-glutamylcyclotransferase family protein [Corallococcus exiguus]NNC15185.1 gamma-glutamylcyclotransferase [Corallococcus exiguus]
MKPAASAPTRVFVYGTLLEGEPNHRMLHCARLVVPAQTLPHFTLYDCGPFPALASAGHHTVGGEVYEVDAPTLAALDRLEGHPHFYQRSPITLDGGARVEAYLFPAARLVGRPTIESGNWRAHLKERKSW